MTKQPNVGQVVDDVDRRLWVYFASNLDGDRYLFAHPQERWEQWTVEVRRPSDPDWLTDQSVSGFNAFAGYSRGLLPGQGCWNIERDVDWRIRDRAGTLCEVQQYRGASIGFFICHRCSLPLVGAIGDGRQVHQVADPRAMWSQAGAAERVLWTCPEGCTPPWADSGTAAATQTASDEDGARP